MIREPKGGKLEKYCLNCLHGIFWNLSTENLVFVGIKSNLLISALKTWEDRVTSIKTGKNNKKNFNDRKCLNSKNIQNLCSKCRPKTFNNFRKFKTEENFWKIFWRKADSFQLWAFLAEKMPIWEKTYGSKIHKLIEMGFEFGRLLLHRKLLSSITFSPNNPRVWLDSSR